VGADVTLTSLISDGMVLQRDIKLKIWGTAENGERVTVAIQGQKVSGVADSSRRWKVELAPLHPGGPFTLTISGKNTIVVHDVLVGEVWVCSGQSNMWLPVSSVLNGQEEVARADHPNLRLFTVEQDVAGKPRWDVKGRWAATRPKTVSDFSAVAYFFGRELVKTLNVPVGLIHSSWGGTWAESWISHKTLESDAEFKSILDFDSQLLASTSKVLQDYDQQFAQWRQEAERAEAEGAPVPPPPAMPEDPRRSSKRASGLFNAMVLPLTPYAIRGVIWYQGEANADRGTQYRKLFPAMIQDWRRAWGEGDFPFLYVQLPNWGLNLTPWHWPELREAQLMALSLPRTGMVTTLDIGDGTDIHPKNKQEVGYRLSLAARAIAYGQDVIYSGPLYKSMAIEGGRIRVRFSEVYDGLVAKGALAPGAVNGFELAGDDHKFVAAEATIDGDTVVVRSDKVPRPLAVRYAWAMNPWCNLYNVAGFPASPFRTDDWQDTRPTY
jgi:sialate O-acetylesterase